jgi:hypothetical protein
MTILMGTTISTVTRTLTSTVTTAMTPLINKAGEVTGIDFYLLAFRTVFIMPSQ